MITIHNTHQTKCQTHSNICIFKFRVLFNFVYEITCETKFLQNFTLCYTSTMKFCRSMVYSSYHIAMYVISYIIEEKYT